uniref:SWIM-type domain-containing protein n=1 Tax=Panagrolaimus davidi TaxID=227884 RepID=A0A914Q2U0_9BILA
MFSSPSAEEGSGSPPLSGNGNGKETMQLKCSKKLRYPVAEKKAFSFVVQSVQCDVLDDASVIQKFQSNVVIVSKSDIFNDVLTCNCPKGAQRFLCKHVIVVECHLKRRKFTSIEARRQTLSSTGRNRPGAPKKHTPALQR